MKRSYQGWILAFVLLAACAESDYESEVAAEPAENVAGVSSDEHGFCTSLVGSWELVSIQESAKALSGEFESDPDYQEAPTLKILNETHWMFIRQAADVFVHAQGGRYSLEPGGFYTEHVEYSAIPQNVGASFGFECRLEGDTLWHHVGGQGDSRYDERWRRIQ